jgi:hypothetical protein
MKHPEPSSQKLKPVKEIESWEGEGGAVRVSPELAPREVDIVKALKVRRVKGTTARPRGIPIDRS